MNIQCDMIFMLGGLWAARFCLVGQIGLEPTMVKLADLQSAAIAARRLTYIAERRPRIRYTLGTTDLGGSPRTDHVGELFSPD